MEQRKAAGTPAERGLESHPDKLGNLHLTREAAKAANAGMPDQPSPPKTRRKTPNKEKPPKPPRKTR